MNNITASSVTLDSIPSEIHSSISDITEAIFYVYQWVREDGSPYYIGKGKGKRAWVSAKGHRPPKDLNRIQMVAENVYEHESFILEKFLIDAHGRKDLGTGILRNLTDGGEGYSGAKITEVTREKLRVGRLGKKHTPEALAKMSAASKGRITSEETKKKISAGCLGRVCSQESILKTSLANRGRKQSPEHTAKVVMANKGRKHSLETRAKISASNLGKKRSPESIEATRQSKLGKKHSEESILIMSLAKKGISFTEEQLVRRRATVEVNRLAKLALLENTKNE